MTPSLGRAFGVLVLAALSGASCFSPNRGRWAGTFEGSVSGVVEFEINARGTRLEGRMTGETREGQAFSATLEGILRQDYIDVEFEGRASTGAALAAPFDGRMTGSLEAGNGRGDWQATLRFAGTALGGSWQVQQVAD